MRDYFNPLEVASELAYEQTKKEFYNKYPKSKEQDMFITTQWEDEIVENFTSEAQDIFNYWYGIFLEQAAVSANQFID